MYSKFLKKFLWLILLGSGGIGFLITYFTLDLQRETATIAVYIFFVLLFSLILGGLSLFPNRFKFRYLLLCTPLLFILGYIDPKMTAAVFDQKFNEFYKYDFLLLYPGIVLSLCAAYRLGGGQAGDTFKIGFNGIILLFSGFLDVMYFVANNIPIKLDQYFAPHIQVVIGHIPNLPEVIIFIIAHVIIAALFNALPLNKWIDKIEN